MEEAELLTPHRLFKDIIRLKPSSPKVHIEKNLAFTTSERLLQRSFAPLDTYIGYYFIYHSRSKLGKIIKGLSQIFPTPYDTGIETLEMIGTRRQGGFTCKYEG